MIVLDASAVTDLLLRTERGALVEDRVLRDDEVLHAPHLLDAEVLRALRRFVVKGDVTARRAGEALADLCDLRVIRHSHTDLLGRAWELRGNLTAYDALYVALAEALGAVFITCDGPLGSAPGHRARIEWIG